MAEAEAKIQKNPVTKFNKFFVATQISLRTFAIAATLTATLLMFTSKQTATIYGITFDARYSYSPEFKFFAFANAIACVFTSVSLLLVFILCHGGIDPSNSFNLFLHDLVMMGLVLAGSSAATAIGMVGQNGNSHTGWLPICDSFGKFCNRIKASLIFSYLSVILLLILTVISASNSRKMLA